jgi:hypothetical protein
MMTNSDDLLTRLERIADTLDITGLRSSGECVERGIARIRDLEVELARYKGFHDGVCSAGTHLIVPVEPTEVMMDAAFNAYDGGRMSKQFAEIYSAMIRAAQEQDND